MNSELKKQVLESLKLGKEAIWSDSRFIHECDDPSIVKLKSTIAAVEAEPDSDERDLKIVRHSIDASAIAICGSENWEDAMAALDPQTILDSLKGK